MKKIIEASGQDLGYMCREELEEILESAQFRRGHGFIRNDEFSEIDFRNYMNNSSTAAVFVSRGYYKGVCFREIITCYGEESEIASVVKPLKEAYEKRKIAFKEE